VLAAAPQSHIAHRLFELSDEYWRGFVSNTSDTPAHPGDDLGYDYLCESLRWHFASALTPGGCVDSSGLNQKFVQLVHSDARAHADWYERTERVDCTSPGGAASLAGRHFARVDEALAGRLSSSPPRFLKLSHHRYPKGPPPESENTTTQFALALVRAAAGAAWGDS
jgi:hypothetical protein